jgi:hypothetical protein
VFCFSSRRFLFFHFAKMRREGQQGWAARVAAQVRRLVLVLLQGVVVFVMFCAAASIGLCVFPMHTSTK